MIDIDKRTIYKWDFKESEIQNIVYKFPNDPIEKYIDLLFETFDFQASKF